MKFKEIPFGTIIVTIMILFGFIFITLRVGDSFTLQKIGTERVKCIDRFGAEFEDEWCKKDVYCSSLGIAGNKRCGE